MLSIQYWFLIQYISYFVHRYETKGRGITGQPSERIPIPHTPRARSPKFPNQLEESEKKKKKPKVMFIKLDEEIAVDAPAAQKDTKTSQVSCKLNASLVLQPLMFICAVPWKSKFLCPWFEFER